MAPFIVVALVASSLFGTGTLIKPEHPVAGTALQGAGLGTLVGGGLGAVAGTAAGTASFLGVAEADVITTAAIAGAGVGSFGGAVLAPTKVVAAEAASAPLSPVKGSKKKVVVIGQ